MEDRVSFDHEESKGSSAASHAGPGIMLLTDSMHLLYKDWRARELCEQIIRCQSGKPANGVMPTAVACLADEIRKSFEVRTDPKDWEQFQLRHIVTTLHRSVLLCGTGLIDPKTEEKRILIVMNEVGIGAWRDNVLVQAKEKFQLTDRETTVVQHLLKGWTNKEIASEIRVTEQTVKEHFKHILHKTETTTRTGVVMRIVDSGLGYEPAASSANLVEPAITSRPFKLVAV